MAEAEGWSVARLSDVAVVMDGRYLAKADYVQTGAFEVHGAGGVMGRHDRALDPRPLVVAGRIGTIGKVRYCPDGAWVNNNALALTPRDPSLSPEMLFLLMEQFDWPSVTGRTAQPFVRKTELSRSLIAFPPLAEQRRIVDLVGSVDRALGSARAVEHRASAAWISWASDCWAAADDEVRLGTLGRTVTGSTPRTAELGFWEPAEVPFFTPGDFDGSPILSESARRVSRRGAQTIRMLSAPSVAQVCIGATYGKVAVLSISASTNQQINALTDLDEVDAVAAMAMLTTEAGQDRLRSVAGITTLPIVKKSSWQSLQIRWPPRETRSTLHAMVTGLADVAFCARREVSAMETLRAAVLASLFSGKREIPASYDRFINDAA